MFLIAFFVETDPSEHFISQLKEKSTILEPGSSYLNETLTKMQPRLFFVKVSESALTRNNNLCVCVCVCVCR